MVFRHWLSMALILTALPALADKTSLLTKAELAQISVMGANYVRYSDGATPDMVHQDWVCDFFNGSRLEISELDVVVVSLLGRKEVYRSPVKKLKLFDNDRVPHRGSLCPLTRMGEPCTFSIEIPSSCWTTETRLGLLVLGGRAHRNATNLHDAGHLISYFTNEETPKIMAAFKKDRSLFKFKSDEGMTPLLLACANADLPLVKFMAANGCSYKAKGKKGHDAMFLAAVGTDTKTLDHLLKQGFSVNTALPQSGRTPLMKAISAWQPNSVKWLLDHGANPNALDKRGNPVLSYVLGADSLDMLKILAKYANIRFHDRSGYGWMHYGTNKVGFLPYLVSLGLNVNDAAKPYNTTPLMTAAQTGKFDAAIWLLEHGANLYAKDVKGRSVFDYAKQSNTLRTDRFFRERIAKFIKK